MDYKQDYFRFSGVTPQELDSEIESQFKERDRIYRLEAHESIKEPSVPMDDVIINQAGKKVMSKKAERGSKYIGVSTNGGKWQVQIMIQKVKYYLGCYDDLL